MKKTRIADFLQSLLMIALFVCLIGQCAFYIRLAENIGGSALETFPDSELILLSKQQNIDDSSYLISPCFAGIVPNGKYGTGSYLSLSPDSSGSEVWRYFTEILENSVKGTAKKVTFANDDEKKEYLKGLYTGCSGCYYVKFAKGIEFSVLTTLLTDTYEQLPENPGFVISDMFLVKGANEESSIIAVDKYGDVLKIFPSRNVSFNNELFETYNNTDESAFEFLYIGTDDSVARNGYFPVLKRSLEASGLTKSDVYSFVSLKDFGSDTDIILKALGMNKDNTKSYVTSEGDYMFVENTTRLKVGSNGNIQYNPDVAGTPIDNILEYSGNIGKAGFGEIAMLSKSVAQLLSDFLYLCDGKVTLYDVSYDGVTMSFIYRYTANGIPVNDTDKDGNIINALRLDFSADRLMYAEINVIPYRFSETASTKIPQKSALALLKTELSETGNTDFVEYFGAEYRVKPDLEYAELVFSMNTEKEAAN